MALSQKVARRIVERVSELLSFNVNVMDDRGKILASGDSSRVGQVHEGAVLAIARGRNVVIDETSVHNFQGAQPGVNVPFTYRGGVYGVIGITGDPDEVTVVAELLRMTAELMVEQAVSVEQQETRRRAREEFALHLTAGDVTVDANLLAWAEQLDVNLEGAMAAVVVRLARSGHGAPHQDLRNLQQALDGNRAHELVARSSLQDLVVLVSGSRVEEEWCPHRLLDEFVHRVPLAHRPDVRVAVGKRVASATAVRDSVRSAEETMRVGSVLAPDQRTSAHRDLAVPVMVAGLHRDWRGRDAVDRFDALVEADHSGDLVQTAVVSFEHDWHIGRTAESLFVHRNTVRYRLDRIAEIVDVDLATFEGRLMLYVGLLLHRIDCDHADGGA